MNHRPSKLVDWTESRQPPLVLLGGGGRGGSVVDRGHVDGFPKPRFGLRY